MKPQPIIVLFKDCQFHQGSTAVQLLPKAPYTNKNTISEFQIKKNLIDQINYLRIQNCILKKMLLSKGKKPTDLNISRAV